MKGAATTATEVTFAVRSCHLRHGHAVQSVGCPLLTRAGGLPSLHFSDTNASFAFLAEVAVKYLTAATITKGSDGTTFWHETDVLHSR